MSRRKIRKGSPQRNVPNEGGLVFPEIFDQYVVISRQESRAVAREPRDAAAVLFGLKFADDIHWTLTQADRDRIEALEMWIWRRMEKISWMDKVTNEDVLKKVNESKNMLNVIRQRKCKWIGRA